MANAAPSVCCLCLTADRQAFTDRAVACFVSQTYAGNAHMLIYDTGKVPYKLTDRAAHSLVAIVRDRQPEEARKVGALRNAALELTGADVIVTFDSDDWSGPERVVCQVASLRDQPATGFHNLLFLDTRAVHVPAPIFHAWEYDYKRFGGYNSIRPMVVGTSLAYWRETWRNAAFSEKLTYEDPDFCKRVRVNAVNGVGLPSVLPGPMLIAETHAGNISGSFWSSSEAGHLFDRHKAHINPEWRRAPEWDAYARDRLYP